MTHHARRIAGALGAAGLVAALSITPSALANEGALYPAGSSIWATSGQFVGTVLPGPVWRVQAPALSPAAAVNHWEMNWGCPVPGSEVAAVRFAALRTQAASSMAIRVTGDRRVLWEEGDAAMPVSPQGGRRYDIGLPGGHCNVHLALTQVEARAQHARAYFIDNPSVLIRDLTAPGVTVRGVSSGWLRAGASLRVDWSVGDNFGSDGVGQQRVVVAGAPRWIGSPGAGDHGVDLAVDGLPDGVHGVQVQADGDGTAGGSASATIHIDRTPPAASGLAVATTAEPGVVAVSWNSADATSGVASSAVEVNTASDGTGTGAWQVIATGDGAGPRSVTAAADGIPDGVHAWRVRTTDVAGNVALTAGPGRVVIDTTAPGLDLNDVPGGWVNRAELDLTATDNLEGAFGPVAVDVDVNTASDGGESGAWQRRATSAGPAGRRLVAIDLSGLDAGRHAVRVIARNGGPLTTLLSERRAVIRVDHERPVISRAGFATATPGLMTVSWVAEDTHAGVATATVQWRDGTAWRTLATEGAGDGAGSMSVYVSALPPGDRAVRVTIGDRAGNTATRTGTATVSGGGVGSTAGDPIGRLRASRLTLSVVRARVVRVGGRRVLARRVVAGGVITVRGRLTDRAGRAIAGSEVQARGYRGRLVGRALTRRDGTYTLTARPVAGGMLRVGVLAQGRLLPERPTADIRVEMRPRIGLSASATVITMGEAVLFSGRLAPAPRDLGLGGRKGVVLEWRDPIRRAWRPVVNAHIRPDGTFAIPWTFGLRGLTIPMRVSVPAEVGWPLLPIRSGVIAVTVSG